MEMPVSKQELRIDTTASFAKTAYADKLSITNTQLYTHCVSVARLAETIARKLFQDMRRDVLPQDVDDIIEAIVHSAILSETINTHRITFEQVADVTNVQVATMVATLSRDIRLVETKRDLEYRGRLSVSPLATQIVAVSRIICTAKELISRLTDEQLSAAPLARKILTQLDGDLLCVHAVSRYYVLRLYAHAARNLITDANQTIKKLKTEARAAKTAAKMTAGIRKRQAAKSSPSPSPKRKDKNDIKPRRRRSS
jgi:hypothetical protein